ncbi:autism susceptibility gene 2 protein homolog [Octopus bimaculoides]|nr:autism susceptibility gene 2 protein homolog [Octopus bimaculoides]|eukprot:XP_014769813.1 PREDICTED: autism susceptibility gene 2 protein-like [Octopus bimaculoides]
MFASPLPPPPTLTSTALQVPANVQSHFADSMSFQATRPPPTSKQCEHLDFPGGLCPSVISPYLHADYLQREVSNRLLAHDRTAPLGPASYMRTEMHQHQHQHMHQHQHTHQHTIGLSTPPFSPSLLPNNAQHLFEKIPRYEPSFYRQGIPGLSYALPSLLTPAAPGTAPLNSGIPGAFQPKTINPGGISSDPALLSLRERVKPGPSPVTPKKTGKWCAVHVQVAWRIYHHQQKQHEAQKGGADTKPVIDPLRPPTHLLPNSNIHRPPDLGSSAQPALISPFMGSTRPPFDSGPTHHSSFLNPAHIGVSPFARPSPYSVGFPGLGNSLFNGARELSSMSTLSPEWNRLHKTPSSFPTPPTWPKTDEREKERERELSLHDRRKEEERERERRNLERLTSLDIDRGREKDRSDRYRETERRRSRSRSRSPIRNGRLEAAKAEVIDKRHEEKASIKIKEERREEEAQLLERDKLLRSNEYLFGPLSHTAATMPVNMLERARMIGPRYFSNERPQLGVWSHYEKGFDVSHHRLDLRDIEREREREHMRDLYIRERMFERMPFFERERYEYEQNKLPALRAVDQLSVGHFPRTVSPMVNHSSKSNSPASIPGAPPPLIPSSTTSHPRSHTNSPASSKSKANSPLDSANELKDKRDSHSSSTDPDAHSR